MPLAGAQKVEPRRVIRRVAAPIIRPVERRRDPRRLCRQKHRQRHGKEKSVGRGNVRGSDGRGGDATDGEHQCLVRHRGLDKLFGGQRGGCGREDVGCEVCRVWDVATDITGACVDERYGEVGEGDCAVAGKHLVHRGRGVEVLPAEHDAGLDAQRAEGEKDKGAVEKRHPDDV